MERRNLLGGVGALAAGGAVAAAPARADTAPKDQYTPQRPLRVQIVMFDGVEEQDFAGPYEVFALAGGISSGAVRVSYVAATPRTITAAFGTQVAVSQGWAPRTADLLVVPGGGFRRPGGPGVWAEINSGVLPQALAAAAKRRGLMISSLCTGAILLAAAGLVTGRPCTTHSGAKADLAARGGVVKNARVVDDHDLVTAAGITSGLDLALHLVARELGGDLAARVEEVLEYQARGTVWRR